jgi:hypothetical protein
VNLPITDVPRCTNSNTKTLGLENVQLLKQTDSVGMGLPLCPFIANFYMEDFEEQSLQKVTHQTALLVLLHG